MVVGVTGQTGPPALSHVEQGPSLDNDHVQTPHPAMAAWTAQVLQVKAKTVEQLVVQSMVAGVTGLTGARVRSPVVLVWR